MKNLIVLAAGTAFGIVLTKSEVISWFRIQRMFRFEEAHMYLVMFSAIAVGAASVWLLKRFRLKTAWGEPVQIKEKPFHKGIIAGGVIFGIGWAITGTCPGPIYAQIGAGEYLAVITFLGALVGAYVYAILDTRLPH